LLSSCNTGIGGKETEPFPEKGTLSFSLQPPFCWTVNWRVNVEISAKNQSDNSLLKNTFCRRSIAMLPRQK
jgi:hypothetical protein